MGFWDTVERFLPEFWSGINERKRIKAIHMENIRKLEKDQPVKAEFESVEESLLGELASAKHFETKTTIQTVGSKKDDGFSIHNQSEQGKIKKLSRSTIRRIRVKNFLSVLFWVGFILVIVALLGGVFSLTMYII